MGIQWSKNYLTNLTEWKIDESTFQALDEERLLWIARVTTTHNSARGHPEESFFVLARATEHFVLPDSCLPTLMDWGLKQVRSHGDI